MMKLPSWVGSVRFITLWTIERKGEKLSFSFVPSLEHPTVDC